MNYIIIIAEEDYVWEAINLARQKRVICIKEITMARHDDGLDSVCLSKAAF